MAGRGSHQEGVALRQDSLARSRAPCSRVTTWFPTTVGHPWALELILVVKPLMLAITPLALPDIAPHQCPQPKLNPTPAKQQLNGDGSGDKAQLLSTECPISPYPASLHFFLTAAIIRKPYISHILILRCRTMSNSGIWYISPEMCRFNILTCVVAAGNTGFGISSGYRVHAHHLDQ